jgi:hypothetical protein
MTTIGHNSGNVPGNWVRISRDMRDHPIVGFGMPVKPADPKRGSYSRAEAWLDLIFEARWAAGQVRNMGKVIMLERGQLMAARSWLAARWNWTEQTVRGFLDRLEREFMVTRQHNHSKPQERRHFANVLTICNYNIFQTATEILERLKTSETTNQQPFINHSPTIQQPESKELRIKEITNNNTPPAGAGGRVSQDEIEGLNEATLTIQTKIAKWIRPFEPDYRTARNWLSSTIQLFGSDAVKEAFAIMETKMASGDVVGAPLKLFTKICQEKKRELDERKQKQADGKALKGVSEAMRRKIEEDREKARRGESILWS